VGLSARRPVSALGFPYIALRYIGHHQHGEGGR